MKLVVLLSGQSLVARLPDVDRTVVVPGSDGEFNWADIYAVTFDGDLKGLLATIVKEVTDGKMTFDAVHLAVTDSADNEKLRKAFAKLAERGLTAEYGYGDLPESLSPDSSEWLDPEQFDDFAYWLRSKEVRPEPEKAESVLEQVGELLGDLGLDLDDEPEAEVSPVEEPSVSSPIRLPEPQVVEPEPVPPISEPEVELYDPMATALPEPSPDHDVPITGPELDEAPQELHDHTEAVHIPVSQEEVLAARRRSESYDDAAYVTGALDSEDQNPTPGATAATVSVPEPEDVTRVPKFIEERNARIAEVQEGLRDSVRQDSDQVSVSVEDLMRRDGGLPKEEAPSEVRVTAVEAEVPEGGTPSNASAVGYDYRDVQPPKPVDNYEAFRVDRHPDTMVAGVIGGQGGSGKTVTSYGLFMCSCRIDMRYPEGRGDQETWLIELDVGAPKWKSRAGVADDKTITGLIQEYRKWEGSATDAQLIEMAKRHSVSQTFRNEGSVKKNFLMMCPSRTDFNKGVVKMSEFWNVIEALLTALIRRRDVPSTLILDMSDYSGEAIRPKEANIVNTMCDKIILCSKSDMGAVSDTVEVISSLKAQKHGTVDVGVRLGLVASQTNHGKTQVVESVAHTRQVPYFGHVPVLPELIPSKEQNRENTPWIGNASKQTLNRLNAAAIRILQRSGIHPMARQYWEEQRTAQSAKKAKQHSSISSTSGKKPQRRKEKEKPKGKMGGIGRYFRA